MCTCTACECCNGLHFDGVASRLAYISLFHLLLFLSNQDSFSVSPCNIPANWSAELWVGISLWRSCKERQLAVLLKHEIPHGENSAHLEGQGHIFYTSLSVSVEENVIV